MVAIWNAQWVTQIATQFANERGYCRGSFALDLTFNFYLLATTVNKYIYKTNIYIYITAVLAMQETKWWCADRIDRQIPVWASIPHTHMHWLSGLCARTGTHNRGLL